MFLLKKLIASCVSPMPICMALLITGTILLWHNRRQKLGKILVLAGTVLLVIFSYGLFFGYALGYLESRYPPLVVATCKECQGVKWIVVLGGGVTADPRLPAGSQLTQGSLCRLIEGVQLYHQLPGSKLLLSGGKVFNDVSEAAVMQQVALALRVLPQDIVLEEESQDTASQARNLKSSLENTKFILVTSASHLPRSMILFQKAGMSPIPAPTDFRYKQTQQWSPGMLFPSIGSIQEAGIIFYESLALLATMAAIN